MKRYIFLIFMCALCMSLCRSYASESEVLFDTDEIERSVPREAQEAVEGVQPRNPKEALGRGLGNLLRLASALSGTALGEGIKIAAAIALIAALYGAAVSLLRDTNPQYIKIAAVLAIAALSVTGTQSFIVQARDVLGQFEVYSKTLLAGLAVVTAAAGEPAQATVKQAVTIFAVNMWITMYDRLLIPLFYIYAALVTLNAALTRDILKRLAGLIKWLVGGILSLSLIAFTAYLSISGAIAGKSDELALRAARAALSGGVPVVGSIISDASETVLAGAGVIKTGLGVFGLIAVLGIAAGPVISLGVRYIIFKLGAALAGTVGDDAVAGYVDDLAGLYALLLAVVASSAFLLLISVASCIMR
ncbi:MAG: stage III sporulation protein AE [Oscillospiraceae bacterium]|nr:stage III sporulation protein AE [Oscillospiraceae bacterium]